MPRTRRLVLVGGGHAHIEVLRAAARAPFGGELVLVSPYPEHLHSALAARVLAGALDESEARIDLGALCESAGARFVSAFAERITAGPDGVVVHTRAEPVTGDICSIDIGVTPAGLETPGVVAHAYATRPQARWRALVALVTELMRVPSETPLAITVVGANAEGVSIALALLARGARAKQSVRVTLIDAGDDLLPELGPRAASRARALLRQRGARVELRRRVTAVTPDSVQLADDTRVESALTVWTPGTVAPPLLRASALPVDEDGFLRVDASLRAVTGIPVYGAGGAVALEEAPTLVRTSRHARADAAVLAHNLRAVLQIPPAEPRLVDPHRTAHTVIDTHDDRALVAWRGMHAHGRWAARFARWLDGVK